MKITIEIKDKRLLWVLATAAGSTFLFHLFPH